MRPTLRVGACQTPEIIGDIDRALTCIERFADQASAREVDLLLFPECFLQGYLVDERHLRQQALSLDSPRFDDVLRRLASISPFLVVGLIEHDGDRWFNAAVVIERGSLVGIYRKRRLLPGERLFSAGDASPTFEAHDIRFGINICYDTQFGDGAARVADQGARLLLVPAQNMLRRPAALRWKDMHHASRAQRARETGLWVVSADVTGQRGESHVGWGPTSVIDPSGELVAQAPLDCVGMVVADIGARADDHAPYAVQIPAARRLVGA